MKLDMKAQGWLTVGGKRHCFMAGVPRSLCEQALDATTMERDSHIRPSVDAPNVCRDCWRLSDFWRR